MAPQPPVPDPTNSTVQRFNSIAWHDSKLVGLRFYRAGSEEQVSVSLELLGEGDALTPAEIIFNESAYIEANVYLEAKRMCSDDISDGECYVSSAWKDTVLEPSPYDVIQGGRADFEQYLHFQITLCPPGGTVNILAREFSLQMGVSG